MMYEARLSAEWRRFADCFKRSASLDELHFAMRMMADYDSKKLESVIFERACESMEKDGMLASDNIRELGDIMRSKFYEIGKRVFRMYLKRSNDLHLTFQRRGKKEICKIEEEVSYEDKPIELIRFQNNFVPRILYYEAA